MNIVNRHHKYLVVDTETGGFDEKNHDLLSIGYIITTRTLRTIEKGEILVKANPKRVTAKALEVNGINLKEHNKKANSRREAVKKIKDIIKSHWENNHPTLVGQNVPFDSRFMQALFKSTNQNFEPDYTYIDLKPLWQSLIAFGKVKTENAKQDTILDYLKIKSKGKRHTALVDADNVLKALRVIKKHIREF